MNISLDASLLLYPHWSGVQTYTYNVICEMIRLGSNHNFILHFDKPDIDTRLGSILQQPNVRCVRHRNTFAYHYFLPLDILRFRSNVYYSFNGRLKFRLPCRSFVTIYDCGQYMLPEHYHDNDPERSRKVMTKWLGLPSGVITISETVKNEIVNLFQVDEERVVVAPCAVNPITPISDQRKPAMLPPGAPYFLMVNPGRSYKNWSEALAAFALYLKKHAKPDDDNDVRLVLAGDLRDENEHVQRVLSEDPYLKQHVSCLGYVSDQELAYLYQHARLTLLPSLYEGFGIPALESMSYGVPLIAADIPVLREVSLDAAYFVPLNQPDAFADALHIMSTDAVLRESLIQKGFDRVRRYSWKDSALRTLDALLEV